MDYNNGNQNNYIRQPGMGQPGMQQPGMGMPNPGAGNPGYVNPGMQRPPMGNPNMGPNSGNPNVVNPGYANPNINRPVMGNPGMQQPGMGQPGMGRPGMQRPPMGNSGMRNPNAGNPSKADIASNRLAREIEKSVSGERAAAESSRPERPGIRQLQGRLGNGRGALAGFALPENVVNGLSGFASYIYGGILVICLVISLIAYGRTHKGGAGRTVSIPTDMLTYNGIFRNAYEKASSGGLAGAGNTDGVLYDDDGTEVPPAPTAAGEEVPSATDMASDDASASGDAGSTEGNDLSSSGSSGNFSSAESYKELLDQIEKAIATGDTQFIANKMAYEDENGTLKAFPQTVIEHFVSYMSANPDKRGTLMADLSSDKYSGQNDGEFIVKLPYIKFVVNMGYDNTTISLPGFSDQVVNAGQSADIAPLMPCMYTLTISNPDWNDVVTRDIEANINESTISINIKP